jgi:plastocyanin
VRCAFFAAASCWLALQAATAGAESVVVNVVDREGQPVADAAVFLTPAEGSAPAGAGAASAIMDQIGYQFVPRLLVVRAGTEVAFPNSDNVRHHVYSFSEARRFELPLYAGTSHAPVRFDAPGLVTLGCNIHDDMVGYILVVDTPWFGKTDAAGRIVLHDVPAASYDLAAWSWRQGDTTALLHESVVVGGSGEALKVAFTDRLRPLAERPGGSLWKAY